MYLNHLYCQRDIQKSNFEIYFLCHVNRMSIKIVANGKIEVNNVKPILHFLTVLSTVMPEIPCLELYYGGQKILAVIFCHFKKKIVIHALLSL
jgi:hypothetical protein